MTHGEVREHPGRPRVAVFGYYGRGNVGDDALAYCLVTELRARLPHASIRLLAFGDMSLPPDASPTSVVRFSPLSAARAARWADVVVLGGGTHLHDFGGDARYLRILVSMLALFRLAKALGARVYLLGVGVGPLDTWWGRLLAGRILRLADAVSVRDAASRSAVESLGASATHAFDLAAGLPRRVRTSGGPVRVLGVSLLPYHGIYRRNDAEDAALADRMACDLRSWLEADLRAEVRVFCAHDGPTDNDRWMTQRLGDGIAVEGRVHQIRYAGDPVSFSAAVSACDAFVAMRYHTALFAYLHGLPTILIAYHPKCRALAREIGLPDRSVLEPGDVAGGGFASRLALLVEHSDTFRASLPVGCAEERARQALQPISLLGS